MASSPLTAKVAVFHPGTQHSWQTATALQQLGRLEFYASSLFYRPDRWPYSLEALVPPPLRRRLHAEFARHEHGALDPDLVRTFGLFEWLERIANRAGLTGLGTRFDRIGNRQFARFLAREIESPKPFALWGYNSSSLETFAAARKAGRISILDRTIGDWRYFHTVMQELRETHGEWFPRAQNPNFASSERDDAEYEAADIIVCGSAFCAQTIREYSPVPGLESKLRVLPYCFDETLFSHAPAPEPVGRDAPVRFLFVGQAGVRKGVHHLLEAISSLPRSAAELTLVGHMDIPRKVFARYHDRVAHIPSVARADIPAIMARHHVLVLPSYFEGSSLSLLEGLASGLALIQTAQAGNGATPDTGIMLDRPGTSQLLAAMESLIDDRERLDRFRSNARRESLNYTFARYRDNIADLLDSEVPVR